MSPVRKEAHVDSSAFKHRDGMDYKRVPTCVVLLRVIFTQRT